MRDETDLVRLHAFLVSLGDRVRSEGAIYLTGGATALLFGWRASTVDVDIKADPEPAGLFEALAALKNDQNINVELASPDLFIPVLAGWRERSVFIARYGSIDFFHYDLYSQALAKLQRRHPRDMVDVRAMRRERRIDARQLVDLYTHIEPHLIRFPAIDPSSFKAAVLAFCDEPDAH
jgi:hypothetical protein